MKRAIFFILPAAITGVGSVAYGDDAGSWYANPMLQYHDTKNDPELKDNFGYQAGFGLNLPHEWTLEADFSRGNFDIKGTDAARRLTGYSIDVIKKFFPEDLMKRLMVQPYALLGGGELDDRTSAPGFNAPTFHTWLAEAGVGLLTGIGSQEGPTRVQLRTEAKYRVEGANPSMFGVKDPSGIIYGVSLQMNFGNKDERAPVIREVVREVPSPPQPPPPPPPPMPPAPRSNPIRTSSSRCAATPTARAQRPTI